MPCYHEFRRMLSAEGAKPESNNRRKSDLGHVGRRFVGGWVSGYVWYLELSREPKHAAQQMRYQNVDLSNGHCLGTIIIFYLKSRDLLCACAVDIWLYLQYYWANLALTCSLGPIAMSRILSLRLIHAMHALTSWRIIGSPMILSSSLALEAKNSGHVT